MREQQLQSGSWRRKAVCHPAATVEFLDQEDGHEEVVQPEHDKREMRWRNRVAIVGLTVAVALFWVATRETQYRPRKASPPTAGRGNIHPTHGAPPPAVAHLMTRILPGIAIDDAVVRVRGLAADGSSSVTESLDARYRHLAITLEITSGRPPRGATAQTITTGGSDATVIHNGRPSARRTVTLTVIAPHHARIPAVRLHRIADRAGRLPAALLPGLDHPCHHADSSRRC